MKSELKDCSVECRSEGDPASAAELDAKLDSVFDAWISEHQKSRNSTQNGKMENFKT